MTTPAREFVYIGPPDPLCWRNPQLGMRTDGARAALNIPVGFMYDLRVVGEPYLTGQRELWIALAREARWYQALNEGSDPRIFTDYAPAHLVWLEWRDTR